MDQDEAWLAEGIELFEAGELAGAEELLRRIGVTSSLCRDALLQLSRVLMAAGQPAEALRCAEEADNLDRDAASCFQWGSCAMASDPKTARQLFMLAFDLDPSFVDAAIMLGHAERALGEPQAAIRAYEDALRLDDAHAAARLYMAEVLLEQRDVNRANTQLHYLLKLRPDYGPAVVLVGDIAFFNQDFRQAIVAYVKALALGETGAAMLHRLGEAFEALQDPLQACKAYDRALKVDVRHWDTHLAAGRLCEAMGWFNRAHRYYEALAFVQAHRAEAYKGLARVEAGVSRSGLEGVDPAGAPEDTPEYLEGPFQVPEVLAARELERTISAQPRPQGTPPPPPVGPPQAPRRARSPGSGMLESLQQKLRDKLRENGTGPL